MQSLQRNRDEGQAIRLYKDGHDTDPLTNAHREFSVPTTNAVRECTTPALAYTSQEIALSVLAVKGERVSVCPYLI